MRSRAERRENFQSGMMTSHKTAIMKVKVVGIQLKAKIWVSLASKWESRRPRIWEILWNIAIISNLRWHPSREIVCLPLASSADKRNISVTAFCAKIVDSNIAAVINKKQTNLLTKMNIKTLSLLKKYSNTHNLLLPLQK